MVDKQSLSFRNPISLLKELTPKPAMVAADSLRHLSEEDKLLFRKIGLLSQDLIEKVAIETTINWDRQRLYGEITKAIDHWFVGPALQLYADYACLVENTAIPLLNGQTITIGEIVKQFQDGKEMWVYSCNTEGEPAPAKITAAIKQPKEAKCYRIWLDNGNYIEASDNHRFVKRDGRFCRTDQLTVGDSLMPFHRDLGNSKYEMVWDVKKNKWTSVYKMVAENVNDVALAAVNKGKTLKDPDFKIIHHKDFHKENKEFVKRITCKTIHCSRQCAGKSLSRNRNLVPSYNHKIIKIEEIGYLPVYDISVTGSQLFGLDAGIYVHNTQFNSVHNASVWITSKDSIYQKELTKLLERIGIEEKINDWANTIGAFGDMFVELKAKPDLGIYAINDDEHPLNVSRIEHEGCLVGFYKTPQGNQPDIQETTIMSPWTYSHFRVLGTKRRRPLWGDPQYTEYRTMTLITGADTKAITSRYGSSLIQDALPAWKRLRMAEDSLLMAAVLRRPVRYIFKLLTNSQNAESVNEVMEMYKAILMKARAMDTRANSPNYESKFNPLAAVENILMPVWNDNGGDMKIEKLGGDVDIKWIADIEELRNQLSCTLRVPLSLLGGFTKDATGSLGSEAIEKLDIGFARNARKLGRALRQGIKRICQVHLAFMNLDPDPSLFDVEMSEGSSIIEDETRETMDKGLDVVDKMLDVLDKAGVKDDSEKKDITNYLIKKVLKLDDFDLNNFTKGGKLPLVGEAKVEEVKIDENIIEVEAVRARRVDNTDLFAYLPLKEDFNKGVLTERAEANWRTIMPVATKVKIQENKVAETTTTKTEEKK